MNPKIFGIFFFIGGIVVLADVQITIRQRVAVTGRQQPPLYSVLYRIISKNRSVVAAQLAWWLNDIHMVEAENELPYCLS